MAVRVLASASSGVSGQPGAVVLVCCDNHDSPDNWASVSEPHTCDFNTTFSLYICMLLYRRVWF